MVVGSLVESMYFDHEIFLEDDEPTADFDKDVNRVSYDTVKKHIEKSGGTFDYFDTGFGILYTRSGGNIDPEKLNNELAEAYHKLDKQSTPKNMIQKWIHKLRMLYNKWLYKANAEKSSGKIGFFKNILRIIGNWIDKFLQMLSGRNTTTMRPESFKDFHKEFKETDKTAIPPFPKLRTSKW